MISAVKWCMRGVLRPLDGHLHSAAFSERVWLQGLGLSATTKNPCMYRRVDVINCTSAL